MAMRGKLLITGGGGMVGRNIREHPLAREWTIIAPDRRELDLSDSAGVHAYFERERPDAVIHAAGRVGGIQANMAHPVDFLVQNVDLGRNIILGARAAGVQRLVNIASSCMYPRAATNPLAEDLLLKGELEPTNEGYALAKIFATRLCEYIRRESPTLQYKTLIPCNLYGRHDKFAPEHSHLLPAIIHKVHLAKTSGAQTVEIWGDGTARREFMYAGDVADAALRAVVEIESLPSEMNVGLGHDHSINEYYTTVANVIDWRGRFVHDLTKPVGMKQKMVSIERQSAWGWSPKTTLEQGIRLAYHYYTEEYKS
jgi:GDP-L-fucose synthase